ncbi:MAG: hypothetical protein ACI4JM_04945, partial [Oscillospiraceae bacterium]
TGEYSSPLQNKSIELTLNQHKMPSYKNFRVGKKYNNKEKQRNCQRRLAASFLPSFFQKADGFQRHSLWSLE